MSALAGSPTHNGAHTVRDRRVTINCGGTLSQISLSLLQAHPSTLLAEITASLPPSASPSGDVFLDRDPASFAAVLNWYRYGKLLPPPVSHFHPELLADDIVYFRLPVHSDAAHIMSPSYAETPSAPMMALHSRAPSLMPQASIMHTSHSPSPSRPASRKTSHAGGDGTTAAEDVVPQLNHMPSVMPTGSPTNYQSVSTVASPSSTGGVSAPTDPALVPPFSPVVQLHDRRQTWAGQALPGVGTTRPPTLTPQHSFPSSSLAMQLSVTGLVSPSGGLRSVSPHPHPMGLMRSVSPNPDPLANYLNLNVGAVAGGSTSPVAPRNTLASPSATLQLPSNAPASPQQQAQARVTPQQQSSVAVPTSPSRATVQPPVPTAGLEQSPPAAPTAAPAAPAPGAVVPTAATASPSNSSVTTASPPAVAVSPPVSAVPFAPAPAVAAAPSLPLTAPPGPRPRVPFDLAIEMLSCFKDIGRAEALKRLEEAMTKADASPRTEVATQEAPPVSVAGGSPAAAAAAGVYASSSMTSNSSAAPAAATSSADGSYLFRYCNDPDERLSDGRPNRDLFVLSYLHGRVMYNAKVFRHFIGRNNAVQANTVQGYVLSEEKEPRIKDKLHTSILTLTHAIIGTHARALELQ